jgi:hypothetical protein
LQTRHALSGHAVTAGLAAVRLLRSAVGLRLLWSAVRLLRCTVRLLRGAVGLLGRAVRLLRSAIRLLRLLRGAVGLLLWCAWLLGRARVARRVAARGLSVAWAAESAGLHDARVSAPGRVAATE